jgi:hypothetical protein
MHPKLCMHEHFDLKVTHSIKMNDSTYVQMLMVQKMWNNSLTY